MATFPTAAAAAAAAAAYSPLNLAKAELGSRIMDEASRGNSALSIPIADAGSLFALVTPQAAKAFLLSQGYTVTVSQGVVIIAWA